MITVLQPPVLLTAVVDMDNYLVLCTKSNFFRVKIIINYSIYGKIYNPVNDIMRSEKLNLLQVSC